MVNPVRVQVPSLAPLAGSPREPAYELNAGMAELADALDSGSNGRKAVQVQVLLPAPAASRRRQVMHY